MASSIMALGLDFKTTLPCIFLGHCIVCIPITLQGTVSIFHFLFRITFEANDFCLDLSTDWSYPANPFPHPSPSCVWASSR